MIILLQVFGIKGYSVLGRLKTFDPVWSCPADYMHGITLGVMKLLMSLWFDSCHHKEHWYLGKSLNQLNESLLQVNPPSEISRVPRSLCERNYFKGIQIISLCNIPAISFYFAKVIASILTLLFIRLVFCIFFCFLFGVKNSYDLAK